MSCYGAISIINCQLKKRGGVAKHCCMWPTTFYVKLFFKVSLWKKIEPVWGAGCLGNWGEKVGLPIYAFVPLELGLCECTSLFRIVSIKFKLFKINIKNERILSSECPSLSNVTFLRNGRLRRKGGAWGQSVILWVKLHYLELQFIN